MANWYTKKPFLKAINVFSNRKKGWTGLHWACGNGDLAVVKYLVEEAHARKNIRKENKRG